jgi:hypothetical protein
MSRSKGFWRCCTALERIRFLDFAHRPMLSQKHNVSETWSVSVFRQNEGGPSSVGSFRKSWTIQWLRLDITKGPNRVGATLILPEDGNRCSFPNAEFLRKQWTMDKVQKPDSLVAIKGLDHLLARSVLTYPEVSSSGSFCPLGCSFFL